MLSIICTDPNKNLTGFLWILHFGICLFKTQSMATLFLLLMWSQAVYPLQEEGRNTACLFEVPQFSRLNLSWGDGLFSRWLRRGLWGCPRTQGPLTGDLPSVSGFSHSGASSVFVYLGDSYLTGIWPHCVGLNLPGAHQQSQPHSRPSIANLRPVWATWQDSVSK